MAPGRIAESHDLAAGVTPAESIWRLGLALGLGLLVGLQRERASSRIAGLRSFALFSLFGYLCGVLHGSMGAWISAAGLVALSLILVAGNFAEHQSPGGDPGVTTEAAALLVFANGVHVAFGPVALSTAAGVLLAALLAFKVELHSFAHRLDESDFKAAVQLSLLSFVILPVLPDQTYGPYAVFNPRNVWWMVLLIAGIGFAGYLAHKFMPQRAGMLVSGFVGGLVSSTATTVSYARRVAEDSFSPVWAATIVTMASAVVYVRLTLEIAVASPTLLAQAAPPFSMLFLLLVVAALVQWRRGNASVASTPLSNPSQLGVAMLFALVYVLVLFAAAAARDWLGNRGLYLVALVSGLTDVDAITLSTARMVETGSLDGATGWRVVVTATLSNLAAKSAMAASLGGRALLRQIALPFGAAFAGGLLAIWLY